MPRENPETGSSARDSSLDEASAGGSELGVIAGTLPSADGSYSTACAIIVKKVDAQSRAKTSVNELLRS